MLEIKESTEYVYMCDSCGKRYKPRDGTEDAFMVEDKGNLPYGWVSCLIDARVGTEGIRDDEGIPYKDRQMGRLMIQKEFVFCCKECMRGMMTSMVGKMAEDNIELK